MKMKESMTRRMEKKIVNVPSNCKAKPKQSLHARKIPGPYKIYINR